MKYKYKKMSWFLQWLFIVLVCALMILFYYLNGTSERTLYKMIGGGTGLLLLFFFRYTGDYLNKYVELQEEVIRFNSFILRKAGTTRSITYNVRYEDIISVECRTIPIIGLYAIYIVGKNLPSKIPITLSFSKHRDLCRNLCATIKLRNPRAYVDPRIDKYCERANYE